MREKVVHTQVTNLVDQEEDDEDTSTMEVERS